MLSSTKAVTEPPRVDIPRIGERVNTAKSTPRIMKAVSAFDLNSLLEIRRLVARYFVDDKVDPLALPTIWTRVLSPRHFMMVSPFDSLMASSIHGPEPL
jgi:hypothetical protein